MRLFLREWLVLFFIYVILNICYNSIIETEIQIISISHIF